MSFDCSYQYEPLTNNVAIRLLELKPAISSDLLLQCELLLCEASAIPAYEAVSYVWGSDQCPQTLQLPTGHLKITESLASALKGFRFRDKSRLLWVDAVCINQSDNVEKARQVSQMVKIYGNAARVLAWLGENSAVPLDVDSILDLARRTKSIGLKSPKADNRDTILKWVYGDLQKSRWIMGVMNAVESFGFPLLYESAWFTRMWIVQETLLAKQLKLHYGTLSLDWEDFQSVMVLIHAVNAAVRSPMKSREHFVKYAWALIDVRDHWQQSIGNSDEASEIGYYMHQFRNRRCKDDRDRVFALRGLLPDNAALDITPDYTKPVTQVYSDFVKAQLKLGSIGILYEAGLWKRKHLSQPTLRDQPDHPSLSDYLPTWAPDYRHDKTFTELTEVRFGTYFGKDPKVPSNIDFSKGPYRLSVRATLIDIITIVQPAIFVHDEAHRTNDILMFLSCRRYCMNLKERLDSHFENRQYPTQEDPTTAFAYSLVGGGTDRAYNDAFISKPNKESLDPLSLWKIYEKLCISENGEIYAVIQRELHRPPERQKIKGIGVDFYRSGSAEASMAWNYQYHLINIFRRHWFFISDDGYTGLAPLNFMTVTDVLAFIDGANVPFVLRDSSDETSDFLLVGPCYIHGLMDWEAVKQNAAFEGGTIQII
ncbi:MAG: hypothetical protein Q9204_001616 [Flavoplaca sp. TL-2023a]